MSCIAVTPHRAQLGEGPFWDAPTQALYWVNIAGKQALRLMGGQLQVWQLPEHVSAFIPCESGDALVTLSSGVYRLDLATEALTLLCVADPQPGNRGNEARCAASGPSPCPACRRVRGCGGTRRGRSPRPGRTG